MFPLTYLDDRTEFRSLQTTSVFMSAEKQALYYLEQCR